VNIAAQLPLAVWAQRSSLFSSQTCRAASPYGMLALGVTDGAIYTDQPVPGPSVGSFNVIRALSQHTRQVVVGASRDGGVEGVQKIRVLLALCVLQIEVSGCTFEQYPLALSPHFVCPQVALCMQSLEICQALVDRFRIAPVQRLAPSAQPVQEASCCTSL